MAHQIEGLLRLHSKRLTSREAVEVADVVAALRKPHCSAREIMTAIKLRSKLKGLSK